MHRKTSIEYAKQYVKSLYTGGFGSSIGLSPNFCLSMLGTLSQAVPFVVDNDHLPQGSLAEPDVDDLRMPFQVMYVDYMQVYDNIPAYWSPIPVNLNVACLLVGPAVINNNVVLDEELASFADNPETAICVSPFFIYRNPKKFMSMSGHLGIITEEGFYLTRNFMDGSEIDQTATGLLTWILSDVMVTLTLMNTENTYVDRVSTPPKLAAKREKKGKLPIPEFHVIKVKKTTTRGANLSDPLEEVEHRKSPRGHIRRGHWRRYQSGKKIFIHSMMVAGGCSKVEYMI